MACLVICCWRRPAACLLPACLPNVRQSAMPCMMRALHFANADVGGLMIAAMHVGTKKFKLMAYAHCKPPCGVVGKIEDAGSCGGQLVLDRSCRNLSITIAHNRATVSCSPSQVLRFSVPTDKPLPRPRQQYRSLSTTDHRLSTPAKLTQIHSNRLCKFLSCIQK